MAYVVKINTLDHTDIEGYYTGKMIHYRDEGVTVPDIADDKTDLKVKIYKRYKNAENAMSNILDKASFVKSCTIEAY